MCNEKLRWLYYDKVSLHTVILCWNTSTSLFYLFDDSVYNPDLGYHHCLCLQPRFLDTCGHLHGRFRRCIIVLYRRNITVNIATCIEIPIIRESTTKCCVLCARIQSAHLNLQFYRLGLQNYHPQHHQDL